MLRMILFAIKRSVIEVEVYSSKPFNQVVWFLILKLYLIIITNLLYIYNQLSPSQVSYKT